MSEANVHQWAKRRRRQKEELDDFNYFVRPGTAI